MAGTNPRVFGAVMDAMMASPDNEALVTVVGSSSQFRRDRAVVPIIERAKASAKPVAVFLTPDAPESSRLLVDASIAVFRTPEACADAVRAYFSWRAPMEEALPLLPYHDALTALAREAATGGDASKLLDRLGIEQARAINVAIGASEADVAAAVTGLKFPIAIKIVSADIPHKTEAGGVLLNVANIAALRAGLTRMRDTVMQRRPDAKLEGFSIQEMRTGLGEVLVGYRVDPRIGPTIVVGVGGVLAEIYRDAVVALAPVSVDRAHTMISQLRGLAPLRGYRNLPEGDLPALARAVSTWSRLAQLPDSGISEAELNPLIIGKKGEGVVAVDALLVPR